MKGVVGGTCALLSTLLLAGGIGAADQSPDDVAARVNGNVISRQAVREVVQALASAQDTAPDAKQLEKLAHDALDSLIAFELLYQESQRRKIAVTEAEVEADQVRMKAQFGDPGAYDRALAARGITAADVRRDTVKTLSVNRMLEQSEWQNIQITPDESKKFYEENREQFKHDAEVHASHILIRTPKDASAADRAKARKTAEEVLAQLKAGADFAQLARTRSQDPVSSSKGGDLGFFARGTMEASFEQAAFALAPGALSDVVQTPYGYHIIKVAETRPAGYSSLAEVQGDIAALLRDEEKRRRQDQLVATLKQSAKVEILPLLKPTPPPKKK